MSKIQYLNEKHLLAMEKRMKGLKYAEIAQEVGVSLDTVKTWFRKNGLLQTHYGEYARYIYEKFYQNARVGTVNAEIVRNILTDKTTPGMADGAVNGSKPQRMEARKPQ